MSLEAPNWLRHGRLVVVLKIVVGIGLLILLLRQVDKTEIVDLLRHARPFELAAAGACLVIAGAVNAIRWNAILARLGAPVSQVTTLVGTFEGLLFNLFLPTSVGGDAVRAYRVFDHGVTAGVAVQSALIDRAIGLWGVGLSLLAASPLALRVPQIESYGVVVVISIAIVFGGAAVAMIGKLVATLRFKPLMRPFGVLVRNYGEVVLSRVFVRSVLPALLFSVALTSATMWFGLRSLNVELAFTDAVIVIQVSTLAALLPISFGGWGVREGVTAYLLVSAGISTTSAIAASVLFGFALMAPAVIGAALWLNSPYRGLERFSQQSLSAATARQAGDEGKAE